MAAITFDGVTKSFSRQGRQMLLRSFLRPRLKTRNRLVALHDLSFELEYGESVAVVGRNGAGKSTLLNLMAGLLRPDKGKMSVEGRLAALLDLGAGFHPDLTGAENLFVNAALLGLSRKEVDQRYDSIVEFSGLGDFIDQPMRTYSSGMVMRLAFAVAVNVDTDILVIDEVLSVGDPSFQEKCFAEILRLKESGALFICVSHATAVLRRLCKRGLWLEQGELVMNGDIDDVMHSYERNGRGVQIRTS
jgi:ABC-type polysaccharide/polyol phosphate transport system ATPase subunit